MRQESGRSMIEMLGVLAIIGVLSVGAIAGYQKAMMKYKLNKHTQQIGSILDYISIHGDSLPKNTSDFTKALNVLNIIPKEMIKNYGYKYYDVFNNPVRPYYNCDGAACYYALEILIRNDDVSVCNNLLIMAKLRSAHLWHIVAYRETPNFEDHEYSDRFYGDNDCYSHRQCLKNLDLSTMETYCSFCNGSQDCRFYFLWGFNKQTI